MKIIINVLSKNTIVLLFFKLINNVFFIKNKNKIIFSCENLNYSNGWIFKRWFEKNKNTSNIELIYLTQKKEFENTGNLKNYNFLSFNGIKNYIQSKYILSIGGPVIFKSSLQIEHSIWHGIPIKTIPIKNKKRNYAKLINKQITVSKFVSLLYSFDWNLNYNQFLELGEPIYDYFNNPEEYLKEFEKNIINSFLDDNKENILYAPTYRNSKYGLNEGDNIDDILQSINNIIKNNPDKNFIISLHPQEFIKEGTFNLILKNSNCKILKGISTEKILPFIDTLIFDYSSLYFQGLYLDKKLICYIPDFKKYNKNRGLIFESNEIINPKIICNLSEELGIKIKENSENNNLYRRLIFPNEVKNSCEKIFNNLINK